MLLGSCARYAPSIAAVSGGSWRLLLPCRLLRRNVSHSFFLTGTRCFCVVCHTFPRLQRLNGDTNAGAVAATTTATTMTRRRRGRRKRAEGEVDGEGVDIDMELEPVDLGKLALPLHLMETIPPDVIANIVAKDKTIVFSPHRKKHDVMRRITRMKYRYSVQPLGKVFHFCFFSPTGTTSNGAVRKITPEDFQRVKDKLRMLTRFIIVDKRWPLEVSVEVTPIIERAPSENNSLVDVANMLSRTLADELRIGAWCGISSTPVLAKMACEASRNQPPLRPAALASGGILSLKHYDLPTHESLKEFLADVPLSDIPVLGKAQVELLKSVYGIKKCGDISAQEDRMGFSLAPATMDFFLSIAYGAIRLENEIGITLRQKGTRCKAAQIRRESQYGRIVSEEQFINTVLTIFDSVHKDLLLHDFVTGRVSIDTRRTVPRVFWVTEEYEEITPRTNNREILRETTLRLAKRFAPRRTKEFLDVYIVSIHFSEIRTWDEEYGGASITHGNIRRRRRSGKKFPSGGPGEKDKVGIKNSLMQWNEPIMPRGITVVM
ncbi:hypothetical protein C3747_123g134 [Trypanosoma cruzi]|uniref:UmuC domain-containing protein n=2 Tax=Trypanosoma cruzi TaxID=5693 RepID=Q4D5H7_TRYCC|nr:hypothetical protein, conserved [Trypanosoma cruzi]EAN87785.1 hypothetical protein, conserved [Trypanosoma cruzi]PWV05856.1 hypothetical protein C3747_123g134 [Trypanosoma cruzi]|eukprot:XP_809636.1 hypothetical protein [Trypanosoma cruzi strain CL Brener]